MENSLISLLQAAASLLLVINPRMPSAMIEERLRLASNAVQVVSQATAMVPPSDYIQIGIWPNIQGLYHAWYRDLKGSWVRDGSGVFLIDGYTSFGDLNGDGIDDAAVVVNKPDSFGVAEYFLVAMLNQGGIMFDVAEISLGKKIAISSHRIVSGRIIIDSLEYELFGNKLRRL